MLVDVHAHLDSDEFKKDLQNVIIRAKRERFFAFITNGTDPESNRNILKLSKKYPIIKPALGMYPSSAISLKDDEIEKEINFIRNIKPIAIGEVGLDNHRVENLNKQKKVLKKLAKLAIELKIPLIVHSRKAEKETIDLLEEVGIEKVIMHCFSGNSELTKRAVSKGWMFSIPSMILKSKTYRKLAKRVPLNQLLTETDSPFLSPFPDKRNEPISIVESLLKIAEIKEIDPEELKKIIYINYQKIF